MGIIEGVEFRPLYIGGSKKEALKRTILGLKEKIAVENYITTPQRIAFYQSAIYDFENELQQLSDEKEE